ncbi:MAG: hypothetical protein ACLP0H_18730 [Terriglobales bacterium]
MFAESTKKGKSEKRGRFNAGEKDVLALAIEAKLTTVKGQVLFNEDGTRTEGAETRNCASTRSNGPSPATNDSLVDLRPAFVRPAGGSQRAHFPAPIPAAGITACLHTVGSREAV